MSERTVGIVIEDDGAGRVIWSDDNIDPDLDELIEYLIDEAVITGPGVYCLQTLEPKDHLIDFGIYTITENPAGDLTVEWGFPRPKTPKLTSWPPK